MRERNRDECDQRDFVVQTGMGGVIKTMLTTNVEASSGEKGEVDCLQKLEGGSDLNKEKLSSTAGDLSYSTVQKSVVRRDVGAYVLSPPPTSRLCANFYHPGCTESSQWYLPDGNYSRK